MKALFWKKLKELYINKIRIVASAMVPLLYIFGMIYQGYSFDDILFLFPIITIILCWIILYSVEDIIFAEVVLGTGITIKDIWLFNLFFEVVIGFLYSIILVVITYLIKFNDTIITFNNIFTLFFAFVCGLGLISFATFYVSDYSRIKNIFSSIGAIVNIAIIIFVFAAPKWVAIIVDNGFTLIITISLLLCLISYYIVKNFSNPEKFVMNIKKLGLTYENNQSIDE